MTELSLIKAQIDILFKMAGMAYWETHSWCGSDFDRIGCKECYSYEFCRFEDRFKELKRRVEDHD